MKNIFLGALLAAIPLLTLADDAALYQVELIIFENLDSTTQGSDVWRKDPGTPDVSDASLLRTAANVTNQTEENTSPGNNTDTMSDIPVQDNVDARRLNRVSDNKLKLTPLRQRMLKSGKYHPLVHTGWIQSLAESDSAIPVRLYRGSQEATPAATNLYHPLDGIIKVRRSRYLHVDVDLIYSRKSTVRPAAPPSPEAPPPEDAFTEQNGFESATAAVEPEPEWLAYRMVESRRTRSNELQYFDHPLFGMLVQISPVERKQ